MEKMGGNMAVLTDFLADYSRFWPICKEHFCLRFIEREVSEDFVRIVERATTTLWIEEEAD